MYKIKSITPVNDVLAGYIGAASEEDVLIPIVCWAVVQVDDADGRVVGMTFDSVSIPPTADLMEADDDESFIGFYKDTEAERIRFASECKEARETLEDDYE